MLSGRVLDVVRSEAGLATLFDRKVNRGNVDPLPTTIAEIITKYGLNNLQEAAAYEREVVAALKYRHDFLADTSLSQPPPLPASIEIKDPARPPQPEGKTRPKPVDNAAHKPPVEPTPAPEPESRDAKKGSEPNAPEPNGASEAVSPSPPESENPGPTAQN